MEKKKFATNIKLRQFAQEQGISAMTLYRILNNEPNVRAATRKRIAEALSARGCYAYQPPETRKIVLDFSSNNYLLFFGNQLMQQLANMGFSVIVTNHRRNSIAFFDAAAEVSIVVFCSEPDEKTVAEMRKANPHVFALSMFGNARNVDVLFSCNDAVGTRLAASHLYRLGHRKHIVVHRWYGHKDAEKRISCFCSEMKRMAPGCRIDVLDEKKNEDFCSLCRNYFLKENNRPSVFFFVMDSAAHLFRRAVVPFLPEDLKKIGIMSYDSIDKISSETSSEQFDRVDFSSQDILKWMAFLISTHPMLGCESSIEIAVDMKLCSENTVPDLLNESSHNLIKNERIEK